MLCSAVEVLPMKDHCTTSRNRPAQALRGTGRIVASIRRRLVPRTRLRAWASSGATSYLLASSPRAWSAAAPVLLTGCLGLAFGPNALQVSFNEPRLAQRGNVAPAADRQRFRQTSWCVLPSQCRSRPNRPRAPYLECTRPHGAVEWILW